MSKCPSKKRQISFFDHSDHSQSIVMIEFDTYIYDFKSYARPNKIFDYLHNGQFKNWKPSTTTILHQDNPLRPSAQTLISFASNDDAADFAFYQDNAHLLRPNWWEIFEGAEYKRHPIFHDVEMSRNFHFKLNGQRMENLGGVKFMRMIDGYKKIYCSRTVYELMEDIWSTEASN